MAQLHFEHSYSYDEALARAADGCGIDREYWDIFHKRHEASAGVRARILQALGWDVSGLESLEQQRRRRFEPAVLPRTLVIDESDKTIPLHIPTGAGGTICFELLLEDGQRWAGTIDVGQLRTIGHRAIDGRHWPTYLLSLPAETPLGYHTLKLALNDQGLGECKLIVCPEHAYLPEKLAQGGRTAGFNVSLYGLRSDRNWGCGDFTDLKNLVHWARTELGVSFIGLNPLHALHNRVPYNTSPYLPLSIYYKNLIYIDIESVPEFKSSRRAHCVFELPRVQGLLRRLRESDFVGYSEVDQIKRRFLRILFHDFVKARRHGSERSRAFEEFCREEGDLLHRFALYCALDEILHKQNRNRWTWRDWPMEYQSPESDACRMFAERYAAKVEFYKFVQFVAEEQLQAVQEYAKDCGMPIGLYHDLAVATDSCGSDLWAHRRFYVDGCRVGAPPDDFSPNGQDWAFPPPNVVAHQESGYHHYRESIRKIVRHGGALRIDHVMRLFRLFWIPEGFSAAQGTYVRDNATDLMRILALESIRSKNVIIGEDLGTVTDEIREMLGRFRILSYRLFYFEKRSHDHSFKGSYEYPRQALVASSTHDLPTMAGFWTFRDIEARKAAGLIDDHGYHGQREDRKREKQRMLDTLHAENLLPPDYPKEAERIPELDGALHNAIVGFLAQVPSMILLLNQEDFTKETEQQNLPGSTSQYPNWQRKMKVKIEDLDGPACQPYTQMLRNQLARTGRI